MLSINFISNNLEQKEHKWLFFFYKATMSIIAVTVPANVFFSSQVNNIRQLVMKFFDIIKFKKIIFKSKDIVNHFFTFTFLKKLITRFKIILFTHSFFCLCQTFDPLAEWIIVFTCITVTVREAKFVMFFKKLFNFIVTVVFCFLNIRFQLVSYF